MEIIKRNIQLSFSNAIFTSDLFSRLFTNDEKSDRDGGWEVEVGDGEADHSPDQRMLVHEHLQQCWQAGETQECHWKLSLYLLTGNVQESIKKELIATIIY